MTVIMMMMMMMIQYFLEIPHFICATCNSSYLLPEKTKHAKQKTPVKKKDCNPVWNHTFVFEDIAWADLKERCLELTVWDHDRFTSNDFLGGVRLGLGTGIVALVFICLFLCLFQ